MKCIILIGLLLAAISATATEKEPQWFLNNQELALVRVYMTPNGEKRWVKTITRKQLNSCLSQYPYQYRTSNTYINFCLCKLSYGSRKCNK